MSGRKTKEIQSDTYSFEEPKLVATSNPKILRKNTTVNTLGLYKKPQDYFGKFQNFSELA